MNSDGLLLVTANVGSVFEDPTTLLKIWIKEFLKTVLSTKPSFLALHLQEVGGKTYEKSMEYVQEFIKNLCESEELKDFNRIRIYLDEDYNSPEHFTALGSLYFAKKSIQNLEMWNFLTHKWEQVNGKSIHTGNIETIATKEKSKFPQHFFPECKWSRKGFLRTRWSINGTVFDMVNIHLFHDASNLAACQQFPSVYCKSRRRALVHTLERFQKDTINGKAPYFIFGDFNFRCDNFGVIKKLTENLTIHKVQNAKTDHNKVQYRDSDGKNVLTVGKKEFTHSDHQSKFKENWLRQFDCELEPLKDILIEYPITFLPSYPFQEDITMPKMYMLTRCPSWCDRILMSPTAKKLIHNNNDDDELCYGVIGEKVCMGDHKPVYLQLRIKQNQGTVKCCCDELHEQEHHHQNQSLAIYSNINNASCLYCTNEFDRILECHKYVVSNNSNNDSVETISLNDYKNKNKIQQQFKINVTDTENNLNVCMCSLLASDNDNDNNVMLQGKIIEDSICVRCRNIIKQQPIEHRLTLISKRLLLANDIIVNRIDTHFLNAYTSKIYQPYTPESAESRSPMPEIMDETNYEFIEINENSQLNLKTTGVSPRQLKSRLERLRKISKLSNDSSSENIKTRSKYFCPRFCVIL